MAVTTTTYVERVLLTLMPDGTLKGASQESIRLMSDGDLIIHAVQDPPLPLVAGSIAALLPDHAKLLAQIDDLQRQVASLKTQIPLTATPTPG